MRGTFRENAGLIERRCASCLTFKPLSAFNRHSRLLHGVRCWCRQCERNKTDEPQNADRRHAEGVLLALIRDGVFAVDQTGHVMRLKIRRRGTWVPCEPRRCDHRGTRGYRYVSQKIDGVRYVAAVHRLVYRWFLGQLADDAQINHINGVHYNLRLLRLVIRHLQPDEPLLVGTAPDCLVLRCGDAFGVVMVLTPSDKAVTYPAFEVAA